MRRARSIGRSLASRRSRPKKIPAKRPIARWAEKVGWRTRVKAVCKPCWELKYCPYGPLVEYFPLHPEDQSQSSVESIHSRARALLKTVHRERDVLGAVEMFLYSHPPSWEWIRQFDTSELGCNVFGH